MKHDVTKLLTIELDSYGSNPRVFLNGVEITKIVSISFEKKCRDSQNINLPNFSVTYFDTDNDVPVVKTISFEDPFKNG
jgi:hypothetical protein